MFKRERTCLCTKDLYVEADASGKELTFHKNREYQVDVFPLYYQVYQNGGWHDYIFVNEEEFALNFKLIE